jgi:hypothetical protein
VCGLDSAGSWYDPLLGSCENRNEPLVSIEEEHFLTS